MYKFLGYVYLADVIIKHFVILYSRIKFLSKSLQITCPIFTFGSTCDTAKSTMHYFKWHSIKKWTKCGSPL